MDNCYRLKKQTMKINLYIIQFYVIVFIIKKIENDLGNS